MEKEKKKKITNYSILLDKMLGEGACGKVYVGEQDNTKLKVAIKILEKKTVDRDYYLKSSLFSEIEILKALKSPNVVGFLDVMESKHCYYIIQEYCDGGELRGVMKKRGRIPEKEAIQMLKQICNGFIELIKEGVMHRDLKPENILLHQGVLKLADFGFSKKDRVKRMAVQTMVGTPLYMSIQILKGMPYSSKCDIWALGAIFYEMIFGHIPYFGNSEYQLIQNIERQPLRFPSEISKVTKDFITRCLAKDENKRFSWDELLRHEIFEGYFVKKQEQNKQFENKFKATMNHIRQQVKENQIDLESHFQQLGGSKNALNADQFEALLKRVDENITKQQITYIFNKIATHGSKTISHDEFQKALQKSGIPMSMIRKKEEAKNNDPYGQQGGGLFDMLVNQIINPNDQALNAYFKNGYQQQQQQQQQQQISAMNQMAMMQQQQQQQQIAAMGMANLGGLGMGLGGLNQMGGMNAMGGRVNAMNNMGGLGLQYGQMGGFGGGYGNGLGGMRNGWM